MNTAKALWAMVEGDPRFMRRLHGWLTILWLLAAVPVLLWWRDSIPVLVFISIYANVAGHWAAYQASRVEVKEEVREGALPPEGDD